MLATVLEMFWGLKLRSMALLVSNKVDGRLSRRDASSRSTPKPHKVLDKPWAPNSQLSLSASNARPSFNSGSLQGNDSVDLLLGKTF